eukprot:469335-Amorphochlora_amoeboformis.AAC.2
MALTSHNLRPIFSAYKPFLLPPPKRAFHTGIELPVESSRVSGHLWGGSGQSRANDCRFCSRISHGERRDGISGHLEETHWRYWAPRQRSSTR